MRSVQRITDPFLSSVLGHLHITYCMTVVVVVLVAVVPCAVGVVVQWGKQKS